MDYAALTDRQLLVMAAAGDEQAFARLYRRYAARLTGYFYQRCGQDRALAEDLCQQVFLRLLESKAFTDPAAGPDQLDKLLFTLAANLLKNTYRSQARRAAHVEAYRQLPRAAATADHALPTAHLQRGLARLPPAQREVVELRYRDGLTCAEIATLLGCATGTVKSRLHYGLRKLAELLAPHKTET